MTFLFPLKQERVSIDRKCTKRGLSSKRKQKADSKSTFRFICGPTVSVRLSHEISKHPHFGAAAYLLFVAHPANH